MNHNDIIFKQIVHFCKMAEAGGQPVCVPFSPNDIALIEHLATRNHFICFRTEVNKVSFLGFENSYRQIYIDDSGAVRPCYQYDGN